MDLDLKAKPIFLHFCSLEIWWQDFSAVNIEPLTFSTVIYKACFNYLSEQKYERNMLRIQGL